MKTTFTTLFLAATLLCGGCTDNRETAVIANGELKERIERNFDKLETPRYQPQNVFLDETTDQGWPGDTEGRTILALVRDAQSSGREPVYLDEMVHLIPQRVNERGYFGPIYEGKKNEQQLSGHGWLLRGLCEYYKWKDDKFVLDIIKGVVYNLFMPVSEDYAAYPVDPDERTKDVGEAIGSNDKTIGNWILSTDVGCIFIATDGLIEANEILQDPEIDKVINDVIGKFLSFDPVGIRAQAHATLTGCRALLRYCFKNQNDEYLNRVEEVWALYKEYGMTENYENYNWFCRYSAHSEPCAIVDSYIVAYQLWQLTGKPEYLDDAEQIYYNGICHTQHDHGGFGLDTNPGLAVNSDELKVNRDEVYWCCTMRGAEGFWYALNSSYEVKDGKVYVPFYYCSTLKLGEGQTIEQSSTYPFGTSVTFIVNTVKPTVLALRTPSWMENLEIKVNGENVVYTVEGGFATPEKKLMGGDVLTMDFSMQPVMMDPVNRYNTQEGKFRICYGPLVLGCDREVEISRDDEIVKQDDMTFTVSGKDITLGPIYHLMDPQVKVGPDYHRQILF